MKQWIFEKFKRDGGIYAICPNCNFMHCVSVPDDNLFPRIVKNYVFCPYCGEYLYVENLNASVIINNQRDISAFYNRNFNLDVIQKAIDNAIEKQQKKGC